MLELLNTSKVSAVPVYHVEKIVDTTLPPPRLVLPGVTPALAARPRPTRTYLGWCVRLSCCVCVGGGEVQELAASVGVGPWSMGSLRLTLPPLFPLPSLCLPPFATAAGWATWRWLHLSSIEVGSACVLQCIELLPCGCVWPPK